MPRASAAIHFLLIDSLPLVWARVQPGHVPGDTARPATTLWREKNTVDGRYL
jgi:hypothetical protein